MHNVCIVTSTAIASRRFDELVREKTTRQRWKKRKKKKKKREKSSADERVCRGSKKNNRFLRVGPPTIVGGRQVWVDDRDSREEIL